MNELSQFIPRHGLLVQSYASILVNLFSIHRQTSCSVRIICIHHCLVWCIFYNPRLEHGMYDLTRRPGRGINTLHNGFGVGYDVDVDAWLHTDKHVHL